MTHPATSSRYLLAALAVGALLGLIYGFLRPLRTRCNAPADAIFVLCAAAACLYLGFGVCGGDLRLGLWVGMTLGGFLWESTVGLLLRPVFALFWQGIFRIFRFPLAIMKKFYKKCAIFAKKHLHLKKNRVQ